MDSAKTQLAERLKTANNILVTVSRNPSIDQLSACIGLTLLLNKLNKHSVAVFSGEVPSTLEFLKPETTLEKTTDSLRDFIIALDKDKADKLRYKVEDNVVRIFITPYRTSISQEDLEFSQGDFNVDVVVALGVRQQQDLDEAITAHGRILHDATVASINLSPDGGLGTINWHDPKASSLSELMTDLAALLGDKLLDNQIATALLTGIVAETNRFSNDKTSSQTMNASSVLMSAGANQQLVATKLEQPEKPKPAPAPAPAATGDKPTDTSTLNISHDEPAEPPEESKPQPPVQPAAQLPTPQPPAGSQLQPGAKLLTEDAPSLGGTLNANTMPEGLEPATDPFSLPQKESNKLFSAPPAAPSPAAPAEPLAPFIPPTPATPATPPTSSTTPVTPVIEPQQTLSQIEQSVSSQPAGVSTTPSPSPLDTARDEVNQALQASQGPAPSPIEALNAQPLGDKLHPSVLPFSSTPESSDTDPQPKLPTDTLSPSPQIGDSASSAASAPPVPPPFAPPPL